MSVGALAGGKAQARLGSGEEEEVHCDGDVRQQMVMEPGLGELGLGLDALAIL